MRKRLNADRSTIRTRPHPNLLPEGERVKSTIGRLATVICSSMICFLLPNFLGFVLFTCRARSVFSRGKLHQLGSSAQRAVRVHWPGKFPPDVRRHRFLGLLHQHALPDDRHALCHRRLTSAGVAPQPKLRGMSAAYRVRSFICRCLHLRRRADDSLKNSYNPEFGPLNRRRSNISSASCTSTPTCALSGCNRR